MSRRAPEWRGLYVPRRGLCQSVPNVQRETAIDPVACSPAGTARTTLVARVVRCLLLRDMLALPLSAAGGRPWRSQCANTRLLAVCCARSWRHLLWLVGVAWSVRQVTARLLPPVERVLAGCRSICRRPARQGGALGREAPPWLPVMRARKCTTHRPDRLSSNLRSTVAGPARPLPWPMRSLKFIRSGRIYRTSRSS